MNLSTIEIRDPDLDGADIGRQIQARVAQRHADHEYPAGVLQAGPTSLQQGSMATADSPLTFTELNDSLLQLLDQSILVEPEFTSGTPVVGSLIVALRRAWNWMSTRWYVLPILKQQSSVNVQLVEMVAEMAERQELQAQELEALRTRLADLETRQGKAA